MRAAALLQRAACSVVTCHLQLFPFGPFDISLYCTFAEASLYILQNLVESLSVKNSILEKELNVARKSSDDTMEKLKDVEGKCNHLQQNLDKYVFGVLICIKNCRILETIRTMVL